jgi:hypothetical protein
MVQRGFTVAQYLLNSGNRTPHKAPRSPMSNADGSPLSSHDWTIIVPVRGANAPPTLTSGHSAGICR